MRAGARGAKNGHTRTAELDDEGPLKFLLCLLRLFAANPFLRGAQCAGIPDKVS
jgi:hypothetical protein